MVSTISTDLTKDLLLVGFSFSIDQVVEKYSEVFPDYGYISITQINEEKRWFKRISTSYDKSRLPNAILCDHQYLVETNFHILTALQSDDDLKLIPFIVLNNLDSKANKIDSMRRGVDDIYDAPIDWEGMKSRIEFLQKFKPVLIATGKSEDELLEYKMPIGKRIFDIAFSLGVLTALSPLLFLVAVLIKLESRGSIVYKSKRAGSGYHVFDFLKFRSMSQGADAKIKELEHLNKYNSDEKSGPSFVKLKNDPRITRVGKVIRKLSIDELPQFINVLKGDMSIVGNRPLPLYEAEQLTSDEWATRFIAPAGITGWWQINKQSAKNLPESERIKLDIEYAENYSIWFDIKIILKTIPAMIQKDEG